MYCKLKVKQQAKLHNSNWRKNTSHPLIPLVSFSPIHLFLQFPEHRSDYNIQGGINVHYTKNKRFWAFFERHKKNTCQTFLMYLTGIMQLGVAKSFSDACVQYQAKNLFIMVKKIYIKLFFIKNGEVLHLTSPKIQSCSEIP